MKLEIKVSIAWWFRWYLFGVVVMCWLSGQRPDPAKVEYWLTKAIRLRVVRSGQTPPVRNPGPPTDGMAQDKQT